MLFTAIARFVSSVSLSVLWVWYGVDMGIMGLYYLAPSRLDEYRRIGLSLLNLQRMLDPMSYVLYTYRPRTICRNSNLMSTIPHF